MGQGFAEGIGVDVVQGELAAREGLAGKDVAERAATELSAARADQRDLHENPPNSAFVPASGNPILSSLLYRSLDHALDDVPLGEEIEDDDRQHGDQRRGEDEVPLLEICPREGGHRDRDRLHGAVGAEHQEGEEVVVPDPDAVEYEDRDDDRLEEGEHDREEGPRLAAAVDGSRLLELVGNVLYEAVEDEDGEGASEAEIGEDDARD